VEDPGLPAVAAAGGSFSGGASGGAKDAQLTRVVDTLRKRLDAYKAENQQLEDMLAAAEQRAADHLRKADALQRELEAARSDQEALVNASAATATAQDVQITRLRQELDSTKQQLAGVSASLAALQQQHQDIKDTQDSIEGGALEGEEREGWGLVWEPPVSPLSWDRLCDGLVLWRKWVCSSILKGDRAGTGDGGGGGHVFVTSCCCCPALSQLLWWLLPTVEQTRGSNLAVTRSSTSPSCSYPCPFRYQTHIP
jgi:prefoldin subunit 5